MRWEQTGSCLLSPQLLQLFLVPGFPHVEPHMVIVGVRGEGQGRDAVQGARWGLVQQRRYGVQECVMFAFCVPFPVLGLPA